ncbi:hypothetical protein [Aquirhabdus parva]|uniref:Uncharacterized protein n=1 Tax=Aquirhabdus parva TaxID=2283318 RepID=A0A345P8Z1_9GAMM|nr:hypothetical protein [Aquirhabdus parva]AXI03750.1 hypothetical protein HYN46_13450 [Aquirhabdus parva]
MKDIYDTKTLELLEPIPKKRGRPATGLAMTPAERKRKSVENYRLMVAEKCAEDYTKKDCLFVIENKYFDNIPAARRAAWLRLGYLLGIESQSVQLRFEI